MGSITIGDADDAGTVVLTGTNTYTGGTTLENGTLELATTAAAGGGSITFAGIATVLKIDMTATLGSAVKSFAQGDVLDLAALGFKAGETISLSSGVLDVGNGTTTQQLTRFSVAAGEPGTTLVTSSDGIGGTDVALVSDPGPSVAIASDPYTGNQPIQTITGTASPVGSATLSLARVV